MSDLQGMGNGFSDFTAKFGLVGMLTWFVAGGRAFVRLTGASRLLAGLIAALLFVELQGECFLNFPLFLGLMFVDMGQRLHEDTLAPQGSRTDERPHIRGAGSTT